MSHPYGDFPRTHNRPWSKPTGTTDDGTAIDSDTPPRGQGRCCYQGNCHTKKRTGKVVKRTLLAFGTVFTALRSYRTREQMEQRVQEIDFAPIRYKLMNSEDHEPWTREKCDEMEPIYRNFLLVAALGETVIIPTQDLDTVWHTHILDTEKYRNDCQYAFGEFLHHFPYLGSRGAEDKKVLNAAFEEGNRFFTAQFGIPLQGQPANCPGGCGSGCSRRYDGMLLDTVTRPAC